MLKGLLTAEGEASTAAAAAAMGPAAGPGNEMARASGAACAAAFSEGAAGGEGVICTAIVTSAVLVRAVPADV